MVCVMMNVHLTGRFEELLVILISIAEIGPKMARDRPRSMAKNGQNLGEVTSRPAGPSSVTAT